jgi:hypothetical protein
LQFIPCDPNPQTTLNYKVQNSKILGPTIHQLRGQQFTNYEVKILPIGKSILKRKMVVGKKFQLGGQKIDKLYIR